MRRLAIPFCMLALLAFALPVHAIDGITLPPGVTYSVLATDLDQPKGIVSPMHRAGAGQFGHYLYVAVSGEDKIYQVDKDGMGATPFADSASFPVGVSFFGGPFGEYLYIGNAFFGIKRVDPSGTTTDFALTDKAIAGLDFGRGKYGNDMYAGDWIGKIWRVRPDGTATEFTKLPKFVGTNYLKFSSGIPALFFTEKIIGGTIYHVAPDGSPTIFAIVPGGGILAGFDFGPGGAFRDFMYVGSVDNDKIWTVDAIGNVTVWASGFPGVADIYFEPGQEGGFVMYVVDGQSDGKVYAIFKE